MKTPLKIALIHNGKPASKDPKLPADYYSECDSPKTIRAITGAIEKGGHTVLPVEADRELAVWLLKNPVDLAFNIAEGFEGDAREARVPALLEMLGIPYTGSGVLALALALDKARSKQIFRAAGIPTPNFQLFAHADDPVDPKLQYPLIVKPNSEGSAKGISAASVVANEPALRAQIRHVMDGYSQEALVEEYIEGTELTVGILGADDILPVLEIDFKNCAASGEFFYSWRMKEYQGNKEMHLDPQFWCPARLSPAVTQAVQSVAWKAARALGTRDISRVDIRLSTDGIPYVLEVNPLPGMDPDESNLPVMTKAAGIPYESFILRLVNLAADRAAQRPRTIPSSIPSSKPIGSKPLASQDGTLPGPAEHGSGQPDAPVAAVRNGGAKPKAKLRNPDAKEENLGH